MEVVRREEEDAIGDIKEQDGGLCRDTFDSHASI